MIEPPSPHLVKTLLELKLCSMADLRRCRGRVKRLARDLPAFDSVWIDALVQTRRLTPFQATLLGSGDPHRLGIGPCVLVERLGGGNAAETYLARQRDGNERCTLKLVSVAEDIRDAVQFRLEDLVTRTQPEAHPSIVAPRLAMRVDGQIALVSRYVPGPHLGGLLVRRGRIPSNIVTEIGAQLIDGLAKFEQQGVVHGDVQLTNVRLTANGAAVLVDFGVKSAVTPELTIHSALRPERCEGIAPELIGTGSSPSSTSDIYALGCLLWHLLAGRAPYMTADPLAKLACHQTKRVNDVRTIAPDVPAHLAEALTAFTNPDAQKRPQSFREVRELWKPPRRSGRKRLAEFSAGFNSAARRIPLAAVEPSGNKWSVVLVLLFVLSGASLTMFQNGKLTVPLSIREMAGKWLPAKFSTASATKETNKKAAEKPVELTAELAELPQPNADGVIQLENDGPYRPRRIEFVGALTLRGATSVQPVIVVDGDPLVAVASQLTIENVHFRRAKPTSPGTATSKSVPLLKVTAQNLALQSCSFSAGNEAPNDWSQPTNAMPSSAMVDWKAFDEADASGGQLVLKNAVFLGSDTAIALRTVPKVVQATNCLKVGAGMFLALLSPPKPQQTFHCDLIQSTLRSTDGFLEVHMPDAATVAGPITVETTDCVFDIPQTDAAFVRFFATKPADGASLRVEVGGQGTLTNREFDAVHWVDTAGQTTSVLEGEAIFIEGITGAPFQFIGKPGTRPGDSAIESFDGPQQSASPPGINSSQLRVPVAAK